MDNFSFSPATERRFSNDIVDIDQEQPDPRMRPAEQRRSTFVKLSTHSPDQHRENGAISNLHSLPDIDELHNDDPNAQFSAPFNESFEDINMEEYSSYYRRKSLSNMSVELQAEHRQEQPYIPPTPKRFEYIKTHLKGFIKTRQGRSIIASSTIFLFFIILVANLTSDDDSNTRDANISSPLVPAGTTSASPTFNPTSDPTSNPTLYISSMPSQSSSNSPSTLASSVPSSSQSPSDSPTSDPTASPSKSVQPSYAPTTSAPTSFAERFPDCHVDFPELLGNGKCNSRDHRGNTEYNSRECGFDAGDCLELNEKYPDCHPLDFMYFGDGKCDFLPHNTAACGYEDGDCLQFHLDYPNCEVDNPAEIGDGKCVNELHGHHYNSEQCGYDGGDCLEFNDLLPNCTVAMPHKLNNGICDGPSYNVSECGYDGGDCLPPQDYPSCKALQPHLVGNGECEAVKLFEIGKETYNSSECGYDGGDCLFKPVQGLPDCFVLNPELIGDGTCESDRVGSDSLRGYGTGYVTLECLYDGGDCCKPPNASRDDVKAELGNGLCNPAYNTTECLYDDGDCLPEQTTDESILDTTNTTANNTTSTATTTTTAKRSLFEVLLNYFYPRPEDEQLEWQK